MIELRINNVTLPLPAGLQLTREIETTIFNREITVTDFTFPIDIPLTDAAIVALGFPTVITSTNLRQDHVCDLYSNGILLDQVVLRILRVSLARKSANISLIGKYGAFARLLDGKRLNQLQLGGVRTVGTINPVHEDLSSFINGSSLRLSYKGCNTDVHINAVNNGTTVTDYVFGQCVDELSDLVNQDTDGLNIINGWQYDATKPAGILDPVRHYLLRKIHDTGGTSALIPTTMRYYWVPQFRYAFLIRKCFEEFGFTVSGAILSDALFAKVVLPNGYAINKTTFTYTLSNSNNTGNIFVIHDATRIDPRNHVPAMSIVEFLQEAAKAFNLHYDINLQNRSVQVAQVQHPADFGTIVDLTAGAEPDPELNFEAQDYSKGFAFSFTDVTYAEVKEDVAQSAYLGAVPLPTDLTTLAVTPNADDVAIVLSENAYYKYDGATWNWYSDNLGAYKTSTADGLQAIKTVCSPVKIRRAAVPLFFFTGVGNASAQYYDSGTGQVNPFLSNGIAGAGLFVFDYSKYNSNAGTEAQRMASCFYTLNTELRDYKPTTAVWMGMQQVYGKGSAIKYPMLSSVPFTATGQATTGFALPWSLANNYSIRQGLAVDFWKSFYQYLLGSIEAECEVLLDPLTVNNTDWNSRVFRIDQLLYLCKKASIVLPLPAKAKLVLVRI